MKYIHFLNNHKQNQWISVKTNVKEDFQTIHKLNVNKIDGIAIMTDTDNSKQEAIGYYKDIYFSSIKKSVNHTPVFTSFKILILFEIIPAWPQILPSISKISGSKLLRSYLYLQS